MVVGGGVKQYSGGKNIKYSTFQSEVFGLSLSPSSAVEHITPGVFTMGNTVMWILSIPFIMYERKCYKIIAVKTSTLHLYL